MTDPFIPERPLPDRVDEWLRGVANDDEIFNFLKLSIGRVVVNRKIEDFSKLDQEVEAARRWLSRAIEMESEWLRRTDDLGRPKKLMKFSDIPGIVKEIRKSQVKEAQYFAKITVSENDEEWFADLDGGFHLVKLKTKQALLREGGVLQNCLGDGDYDKYLSTDEFFYLVLRDDRSRSHAIAEVRASDNLVWELRGKQNATPKLKYLAPFAKFTAEREWPIINRWSSGMVIDDVGHVHFVASKPERLRLRGDLKVFGCNDIALPEEMFVSGLLSLRRCSISKPSERIDAGEIFIEASSGPFLARHIVAREFIELKPDADFDSIADTLVVDGPLQMQGNKFVTYMPSYLRVADWFQANHTQFERLGDDTQILGCVDVNAARSSGTFTIDADRNVVQAGDMVEIIDVPSGASARRHGDIRGKFGALMTPVSLDGGIIDYPGEDGTKSIGLISSSFRKISKPPAALPSAALPSGTVHVEGDTIVVDLLSQGKASVLDDDYVHDFGDFSFDSIFEASDDTASRH